MLRRSQENSKQERSVLSQLSSLLSPWTPYKEMLNIFICLFLRLFVTSCRRITWLLQISKYELMIQYILLFLSDYSGVSRVDLFQFPTQYSALCPCVHAHLDGQTERLFGPTAGFCAEYFSSYFSQFQKDLVSDLNESIMPCNFLWVCFCLDEWSEIRRGLVTWWSHIASILDYLICCSFFSVDCLWTIFFFFFPVCFPMT